jgi:hypothetical protein
MPRRDVTSLSSEFRSVAVERVDRRIRCGEADAVTDIPTLQNLPRSIAALAHSVSAYETAGPEVVVEVLDEHGQVLARTVVESGAGREIVTDAVLVDSYLDRYSGFVTEPLGGRRRLSALAGLRLSLEPTPYRAGVRGAQLAG